MGGSASYHPKLTTFWKKEGDLSSEGRGATPGEKRARESSAATMASTVPPRSTSSGAPAPSLPPVREDGDIGQRERVPCSYYAKGSCRNGDRCRYLHAQHPTAVPRPREAAHPTMTSSASPPVAALRTQCRYYASFGGCKLAAGTCPDLHYNDFGFGVLHVPWSMQNTFTGPTGKRLSHWHLISDQLCESNLLNSSELTEFLVDLLPPPPSGAMKHKVFPTDFQELVTVVDDIMSATESSHFFHHVLPFIKNMCLRCPSLFSSLPDGAIPILRQGVPGAVRLTEVQVLGLLSCSFLCLFPGRHRTFSDDQFLGNPELKKHVSKLGFVNFGSLFGFHQPQAQQKIRCFISYFETQYQRRKELGLEGGDTSAPTAGSSVMHIEIVRTVLGLECSNADNVFSLSKRPLSPVTITATGTIEDADGLLQADFANHVPGGGVLSRGCVQEEIRFAICPELLLSRLLCESLRDNEALIMNGAATFSKYTGYASTFQFAGHHVVPRPTAEEASRGIRNISVVAFDAVNYCQGNFQPVHQYLVPWQQRDMLKALAAFAGNRLSTLPSASSGAIATGNWGCGAFGGDVQLKLVQQWIAASLVNRPLRYFTFSNEVLCSEFAELEKVLRAKHCTVGDLYRTVVMYISSRTVIGEELALQRRASSTVAAAAPVPLVTTIDDNDDAVLEDLLVLDEEATEDYLETGEELQVVGRVVSMRARPQTVMEYLTSQFTA